VSAASASIDGPASLFARPALSVDGVVQRSEFRLDLALSVDPGEIVAVLGPNGAGKTTLLRAIAGLKALSAGSITITGQPVDHVADRVFIAPERRRVGVVFQNYRLFPHLSVRDNVAFGLRSRGFARSVARTDADVWLRRLAIDELADRRPRQLSGGQAQRVALARALAGDPKLLLLDEPLAALDARTRDAIRAELAQHLSNFTGATVLVTHDPLDAMTIADRIVVIENGTVTQQGTPAEVARRPATQYVARLVGLNLYHGRADATGVAQLDDGGTFAGSVAGPSAGSVPGTGRVLVAVRPSSITVHAARPEQASARNVWPATVDGLESVADRVRVHATGAPPALVDVTAGAVAELGLMPGAQVWLSAKATDVEIYPDVAR
jgi:molybdate transport system ATP-binding protein